MPQNEAEHLRRARDAPQESCSIYNACSSQRKSPAEQHSQQQKQVPVCAHPRICINPWKRECLAAISHSFQLYHPFYKELWMLRAAGHHRDLCNMLLICRGVLQAPGWGKGCSSSAPFFYHPPHTISACFCYLLPGRWRKEKGPSESGRQNSAQGH